MNKLAFDSCAKQCRMNLFQELVTSQVYKLKIFQNPIPHEPLINIGSNFQELIIFTYIIVYVKFTKCSFDDNFLLKSNLDIVLEN